LLYILFEEKIDEIEVYTDKTLLESSFPIKELKNEQKKVTSWEKKKVNEWNLTDVESWFYHFDGGKFKDYAKDFSKVNGEFLIDIPKIDFRDSYGLFNGGALYLAIQNLQKGNYKLLRKVTFFHKLVEGKLKNVTIKKYFFINKTLRVKNKIKKEEKVGKHHI
jgi:hypothetical protein